MRAFVAMMGMGALTLLASPARAEPWRLHEEVAPDWLRFGLEHRQRYTTLLDGWHADRPGDGGIANLRTSLSAELRPSVIRLGAELLDSRAYLTSSATAPNPTIVNTLALLQAYGGVEMPLGPGDLRVVAGRMTMDLGSRRLLARNRFRNTINAFTGVDLALTGEELALRAFATMPVQRRPAEPAALLDNDYAFDRESFDVIFAGQHLRWSGLGARFQIEAYALELIERDSAERPTQNRRLFTPGMRLWRPTKPGAWDLELESAIQLGHSRADDATDVDLDHIALLQHASVGYTFGVPARPRLQLAYDFSSGDADPRDGSMNRFDTLFGGRRFEYGPTGVYGGLPRSNLRSVELRLQAEPHAMVRSFVAWRPAWLASARDAWITAGRRDPSGASGHHLGQQIEGRVRFEPLEGNLRFETGAAHLFPGRFVENTGDGAASTVVYAQIMGRI